MSQTPVNMTALESLYKIANGANWNIASMNACLTQYEKAGRSFGYQMLVGKPWDFSRNAVTHEYLVDPCDTAKAGVNFAGLKCNCPAGGVGSAGCVITQVALPCGNLQGSATKFLTSLTSFTDLQLLDLGTNSLVGNIPIEFCDLTNLQVIFMNNNLLNGQVPSQIQQLQQLSRLIVHSNSLSGNIPQEINSLVKLSHLALWQNNLSGAISNLRNLTMLQEFNLKSNHLTGTIPAYIQSFKSLSYLDLSSNGLTGSIPPQLFDCQQLTELALHENNISGTIPVGISKLTQLIYFTLNNNNLTGYLPSEIQYLQKMIYLDLSNNNFGGSIPEELGRMNLQRLNLYTNKFLGLLPQSWSQSLVSIDLSENHFSGTIPASFTRLQNLTNLILQSNFLESAGDGSDIFAYLNKDSMPRLTFLDIANNRLQGTISSKLFEMPNLQTLFIGSNCFSGSLPANICDAPALKTLGFTDLSAGLSCRVGWENTIFAGILTGFRAKSFILGELPQCLFQMPKLVSLHAAGNHLFGSLPATISPQLRTIVLPSNRIQGTLSDQFVRNILRLDLSDNMVGGTLIGLQNINATDSNLIINLQINHLSGDIPRSLLAVKNIDILTGNVFGCDSATSFLPAFDPGIQSYQCGSRTFNQMLFAFGGLIFIVLLSYLRLRHSAYMQAARGKMRIWLDFATGKREIQTKAPLKLREISRYSFYLQMLRWFACAIGIALLGMLILFVSLFQKKNVSVEYSYSWVLTGAYFSGETAAITILAAAMLYITFIAFLIHQYEKSIGESPKKLAVVVLQSEDAHIHMSFCSRTKRFCMPILRLFLLISFIWGIIFGGNIWYMSIQLTGTSTQQNIFKLTFAAFKLFWSMSATPYFFELHWLKFGVPQKYHTRFVRRWFGGRIILFFLTNVITTFIIPILTVFVVDPACFSNYFIAPKPLDLTYDLSRCEVFYANGACSLYKSDIKNSEIQTPFVYNYACTDAAIRLYIPLFQQMFILLILRSTFHFLYLCWDAVEAEKDVPAEPNSMRSLFITTMPTHHLMKNNNDRRERVQKEHDSATKKYNEPRFSDYTDMTFHSSTREWVTLAIPSHLSSLLILITFGFLAPPLGFMAIFSILMDSYVSHLILGRFLVNEYSVIVEAEKVGADNSVLQFRPEKLYVSPARRARMQVAIEEINEIWGAYASIQAAEAQCENVPNCTLALGRTEFIMVPAVLIALTLNDIQNKLSDRPNPSYVTLIVMLAYGTSLQFIPWVFRKLNEEKQKKKTVRRTSGKGGGGFGGEMSDFELTQLGIGGLRGAPLNDNGIESFDLNSGDSVSLQHTFGIGDSRHDSHFGFSMDGTEDNTLRSSSSINQRTSLGVINDSVQNPMMKTLSNVQEEGFDEEEGSEKSSKQPSQV